jgi:uncharacterized OB-fold protein
MIKSKFFLDEEDEVIESPKAESPKEKEKSVSDPNMKYCKKCGSENLNRVKFCGNCGKKLTSNCTNCGAELAPGAKFCPECGTKQ